MPNAMLQDRVQARYQGGAYQRVEVITGRQRRASWSADDKARIVSESMNPSANISEVARRNGVNRGLLNVWRRQARASPAGGEAMFATVEIASDSICLRPEATPMAPAPTAASDNRIEIGIAGATIRIPMGVDNDTLRTVLAALRAR